MKKITWQQVPGWFNFDDVYLAAVDRSPPSGAHFVEIGVLFGRSALFMAEAIQKSGKQIKFDAVDSLEFGRDSLAKIVQSYSLKCPNNDLSRTRDILEAIQTLNHRGILESILDCSELRHLVNLRQGKAQSLAASYSDESLDLAYVDALHTYDDTAEILRAFLPKIRRGGILAGHDYHDDYTGVKDAVRDVLGTNFALSRLSFIWTKP